MVYIEGSTGMTWTVTTDADGLYDIWLDEVHSPLTVTLSYEAGYEAQTVTGVVVVSGTVTTLDADLRWYQPCVSTDAGVDVTLQMGTTDVYTLVLANDGAAGTPYALTEEDLGFAVAGANAVADTFGYAVADSNDLGGPAYDFADIVGVGAPIPLGDDDFAGPVALGFEFPFYGVDAAAPNVYDRGLRQQQRLPLLRRRVHRPEQRAAAQSADAEQHHRPDVG